MSNDTLIDYTLSRWQPFDGYKQSAYVRDECIEGLLSCTQSKSTWNRLFE